MNNAQAFQSFIMHLFYFFAFNFDFVRFIFIIFDFLSMHSHFKFPFPYAKQQEKKDTCKLVCKRPERVDKVDTLSRGHPVPPRYSTSSGETGLDTPGLRARWRGSRCFFEVHAPEKTDFTSLRSISLSMRAAARDLCLQSVVLINAPFFLAAQRQGYAAPPARRSRLK